MKRNIIISIIAFFFIGNISAMMPHDFISSGDIIAVTEYLQNNKINKHDRQWYMHLVEECLNEKRQDILICNIHKPFISQGVAILLNLEGAAAAMYSLIKNDVRVGNIGGVCVAIGMVSYFMNTHHDRITQRKNKQYQDILTIKQLIYQADVAN